MQIKIAWVTILLSDTIKFKIKTLAKGIEGHLHYEHGIEPKIRL